MIQSHSQEKNWRRKRCSSHVSSVTVEYIAGNHTHSKVGFQVSVSVQQVSNRHHTSDMMMRTTFPNGLTTVHSIGKFSQVTATAPASQLPTPFVKTRANTRWSTHSRITTVGHEDVLPHRANRLSVVFRDIFNTFLYLWVVLRCFKACHRPCPQWWHHSVQTLGLDICRDKSSERLVLIFCASLEANWTILNCLSGQPDK